MPSIHFVERKNNLRRVQGTDAEWETGYWLLSEETAQRLIGADLYLHSGQNEPSHFGGTILSFHVHRDPGNPDLDGRLVFRFRASRSHKDLTTPKEGWGNEKKIVW